MKRQIILADDDPDDRMIYSLALQEVPCANNFEIEFAFDGEAVMDLVRDATLLPSMVFLDLNMPRLNGRNCLEQLRTLASKSAMPIVILSTSNSPKDVRETFDLGANIYIQKPSNFNSIKDLFHKCLCTNDCQLSEPTLEKYFLAAA